MSLRHGKWLRHAVILPAVVALGLEWTHEPGTGAKPPANALMLRTQARW